jgi:hypothetical protein
MRDKEGVETCGICAFTSRPFDPGRSGVESYHEDTPADYDKLVDRKGEHEHRSPEAISKSME